MLLAPEAAGRADSVSLADFQWQAVLLNVWATWCAPCRDEMPALQQLYATFGDSGLRVLAVSIDSRGRDDDVRAFVRDFGIAFDILRDPDARVARSLRTIGVPETFLIDREGIIVRRWIGQFDPATAEVADLIRQALGRSGAAGDPGAHLGRGRTRLLAQEAGAR